MGQPQTTPTPLWCDNPSERDLLGFSDIAAPALEALDREKLDPVTVGVVGWWGSGKSAILKLIERELRERGEGVVVVDTRPWEYDPATDPKAIGPTACCQNRLHVVVWAHAASTDG